MVSAVTPSDAEDDPPPLLPPLAAADDDGDDELPEPHAARVRLIESTTTVVARTLL
jgi:hypothetical protein